MNASEISEFAKLIDDAAERGAKRALESLGLHDEKAGADIRDLRTLIESYRDVKSTISKTVFQWVTYGILGLLALGAYTQLKK